MEICVLAAKHDNRMKKINSHAIALAGIGSSISLAAVVASVYVPVASLSFLVVAALGIMLPLTFDYWRASIISYIAVSLLAIAITGPIEPLGFIFGFGVYSIIFYLLDYKFYKIEKLNKWLKISIIAVIKIGYFQLALFAIFKLMGIILSNIELFNIDWKYWILALIGTAAFILYDLLLRFVFINMKHLMKRVTKNKH